MRNVKDKRPDRPVLAFCAMESASLIKRRVTTRVSRDQLADETPLKRHTRDVVVDWLYFIFICTIIGAVVQYIGTKQPAGVDIGVPNKIEHHSLKGLGLKSTGMLVQLFPAT